MKTTPLTISSPILRLIFVLLSSPIFTAYADEVRPYPYIHADAEMVKQAIRLLVDGEYKMAFNRHQQVVLISAPEILHEKIAAVLQKIDRPVKNIQVQVAFKKQAVQTDRGASVTGGGVVIDQGGNRSGAVTIRPGVHLQSEERHSLTRQLLTTRSGSEAKLQISTEVPYLDWFMEYGWRWSSTQARINWQSVGSYLVVQPTIVGEGASERIKIKLTPELSGRVDGQPYAIRYAKISTEVIARNGEAVKIGGLASGNEVYKKLLFGVDQHGRHEIMDIILTPNILELK
jgi:type II secretory pathway component GspD/PulD (secretin)